MDGGDKHGQQKKKGSNIKIIIKYKCIILLYEELYIISFPYFTKPQTRNMIAKKG